VLICDLGDTLIRPSPPVEQQYHSVAAQLFPHRELPSILLIKQRFRRGFDQLYRSSKGCCFGSTRAESLWFWNRVVSSVFPRLAGQQLTDFTDRLFENFSRAEAWEIFPDARQVLRQLKQDGWQLVLLTNWDLRARELIDRLRFGELFEGYFISSEVGYHKPDIRLFELVLEQLDQSPERIWMIGNDPEVDLKPAAHLGLHTIWYNNTGTDTDSWEPSVLNWQQVGQLLGKT